MSVLDLRTETVTPETVPEPIAPGPAEAEAAAKFSTEGALPEVAPQGAAPQQATASELAFENKGPLLTDATVMGGEHGIVTWEAYKHDCEVAGKSSEWKDHYVNGHTESTGWKNPIDHFADNTFILDKNTSASQALRDFVKGPTIADWRATWVALELMDMLGEIGEKKFDRLFGSARDHEDENIPKAQRLRISAPDVVTRYVDDLWEVVDRYDAGEAMPVRAPDDQLAPASETPKPVKSDPEVMVAEAELAKLEEKQPEVV